MRNDTTDTAIASPPLSQAPPHAPQIPARPPARSPGVPPVGTPSVEGAIGESSTGVPPAASRIAEGAPSASSTGVPPAAHPGESGAEQSRRSTLLAPSAAGQTTEKPPAPLPSQFIDDEEEDRPWLQRHWPKLVAAALLLAALGWFFFLRTPGKPTPAPRKEPTIVTVKLTPPPPPPPPPKVTPVEPPKEVPKDEKMIAPPDAPAEKPDAPKDEPKEDTSIGSNIQGEGNDGFGLSGKGGGNGGFGSGVGSGGRGGSVVGWYGGQLSKRIKTTIEGNRRLNKGAFSGSVRVQLDATGRVQSAKFSGTADPDSITAIEQSVAGLQMPEAPPKEARVFTMRVGATRPR